MPYPTAFRDATQIVLPAHDIEGLEPSLRERFMVTIRHEADRCRIVGAPAEIRRVMAYLVERGVAIP